MTDKIELDRKLMDLCFSKLNEKLAASGEKGDILLFGGAAMCLVFGSREYTRDVDAVFEPKSNMYKLAHAVAAELGIQQDWLNDGVKGFLYKTPPSTEILTYSNLTIYSADADYILAMKCFSAREDSKDREDAQFLVNYLGLSNESEVLDIVEKYIPRKLLSIKTVAFVKELFL